MKKTHLMVLALVAGAVVLAVAAVSAYASITSDQAKPVTTTNVGSDPYWDTAAITVTATDNEGVAYIYHKLDSHVVRLDPIQPGRRPQTLACRRPRTRTRSRQSRSG